MTESNLVWKDQRCQWKTSRIRICLCNKQQKQHFGLHQHPWCSLMSSEKRDHLRLRGCVCVYSGPRSSKIEKHSRDTNKCSPSKYMFLVPPLMSCFHDPFKGSLHKIFSQKVMLWDGESSRFVFPRATRCTWVASLSSDNYNYWIDGTDTRSSNTTFVTSAVPPRKNNHRVIRKTQAAVWIINPVLPHQPQMTNLNAFLAANVISQMKWDEYSH